MSQAVRTAVVLALLFLLTAPAWMIAGQKQPDPARGEATVQKALEKFDKGWKPYTNEPNLGDPRWKLKMEVLVRLARAGPSAFPLLEEAAKKGSKSAASTRELAEESLGLLRKAELRKALAEFDLTQMRLAVKRPSIGRVIWRRGFAPAGVGA